MTSKDKSKATQGLPNGTNPDEHCINEFFQFISQYLSKNGYQNLQQIFVERNKLQGQLEGANRALSEVKERLADCVINLERRESKVKALEKEKGTYIDQKTKLEEELSQIKQESKKNLETIEKRQKEQDETLMKLRQIEKKHREANEALQTSLATNERLVDSLDEKKELVRQLDELKSYSSEMVPCETLNSDNHVNLTVISTKAFQWAKDFLFQNLDEKARSSDNWERIKQYPFMKDFQECFPASNSEAAKQVRYAVGLMVLASMLEHRIFQLLYLSVKPSETEIILDLLAKKDAAHQQYARSVLRKVLDEEQTQIGDTRAENAARDVMNLLKDLVPSDKHEECLSELRNIFNAALKAWKPVLNLKEAVVITFRWNKNNSKKWKRLQIPPQESNKSETAAKGGPKNGIAQKKPAQNRSAGEMDNGDMDVYEVWPLIYVKEEVLHPGLFFVGDQFNAAQNEVLEEIKRKHSQIKDARRRERQASDSAPGGADSKRRNSSAFLSSGGGTGPKGG